MLIANANRLIHHFENVVDVKLFTPAQIITIIETASIEIPDDTKLVMLRDKGGEMVETNLERLMNFKTTDMRKEIGGKKNDSYKS